MSAKKKRDLEGELVLQCRSAGVPDPERQRRVSPDLHGGFRWDLYWTPPTFPPLSAPTAQWLPLAVEVMGNIYSGGHVRPVQYQLDCLKANTGVLLGVRVLRVTTKDVENGTALAFIEMALGRKPLQIVAAARKPKTTAKAHRPKRSQLGSARAVACLPDRVLRAAARAAKVPA